MIFAKNLVKAYDSAGGKVFALNGVDMEIVAGQRVGLLGRSGSGKTTLLNMFAGLDRPTSGSLVVAGKNLDQMSSFEMAAYRCKDIGVVFQSFQLIPQRTALQNVTLPLIISGVSRSERIELAKNALTRVGLEHRFGHRPFQMSGGEQQRVAIARAIVRRPAVLLADEPTGNLDSANSSQVMELIVEIASDSNATLVIVTHDQELAAKYSDRILEIRDGKMVVDDDANGEDR